MTENERYAGKRQKGTYGVRSGGDRACVCRCIAFLCGADPPYDGGTGSEYPERCVGEKCPDAGV